VHAGSASRGPREIWPRRTSFAHRRRGRRGRARAGGDARGPQAVQLSLSGTALPQGTAVLWRIMVADAQRHRDKRRRAIHKSLLTNSEEPHCPSRRSELCAGRPRGGFATLKLRVPLRSVKRLMLSPILGEELSRAPNQLIGSCQLCPGGVDSTRWSPGSEMRYMPTSFCRLCNRPAQPRSSEVGGWKETFTVGLEIGSSLIGQCGPMIASVGCDKAVDSKTGLADAGRTPCSRNRRGHRLT
jgi:hypothetical protein